MARSEKNDDAFPCKCRQLHFDLDEAVITLKEWASANYYVCAGGRPNKSRFSFAIRLHWKPPHLPTLDLEKSLKTLQTAVCECMCVCVGFIRAQWRESMNYREASRVSTIRSGFSHATLPPTPFFFFFLNGLSQGSVVFSLSFDFFYLFTVTLALLIQLCRIGLCLVFTE